MVESSKILTVSYGTFSCTLEGFDDSFGTMKAIAEYFRDLAQGDRYFGAEPPAPDAEMLTRIAEKEIERRVEARADESGIVLRAVDALQTPVTAPAMPPVATPPSEEEVAEVATEVTPEVEAPAIEDITESTQAATADMDGDVAGPETGDDASPTLVVSSPAAPEFADTPMDDEMDVTAPAASFDDMSPAAINAVPAHPDADSVAAKLQRIRAVVGGGAAQAETVEADLSDNFDAVEDYAEDASDEDVANMAADLSLDDDADLDADVTEVAEDTVADKTAEPVTEDESEIEADIAEIDEDDMVEAADVSEAETEVADVAEEADVADEAVDPDHINAADQAEDDAETDLAADMEDDADAEAPKQNFRARILRVAKKTRVLPIVPETADDQPEGIADQISETATDGTGEDAISEDEGPASIFEDIDADEVAELAPATDEAIAALSDEDEAELLADLAAVEAEVADAAPEVADVAKLEDDVAEVEVPEVAAEDTTPAGRDILPDADDAAMSRIMDQADEQLSEPEGSRRRSAIAQLKAAVAATEAARQLGDNSNDAAAKESAFRDDLNDAVRPTSQAIPRTEVRAERPRPAPLKLVASQRVDEEEAEAAAVLPRRVSSESTADASNFADFAAEMGATELPDLLEAAAAYTAYVEGIEDFSRPQIMKKVQSSATEEFSREDGLRSFGTLLRQGRISKVRNGRFQVSDQTRFKPEQKAG